jgi:hypothetical protein
MRLGRRSAAVILAACLAGCVTPATGSDSYADKAVTSVRAATSEVATAELTVRQLQQRRIFTPYADETITANESALGSITAAFTSVQPPAGDDALRDDVSGLLEDAEDAVAHARIATRRSNSEQLADAQKELRTVLDDLSAAEKQLS